MVYVVADIADDENTTCPDPAEHNCKHWVRERSQRDQVMQGLRASHARPEDVVMVSDLDELVPRSAARALSECQTPLPLTLPSELFFYSFRWRITHASGLPFIWYHPQATSMEHLSRTSMTPSKVRSYGSDVPLFRFLVGWHCTYFGGVATIRQKLAAYTHQEMNVAEVTDKDHIQRCITSGQTLSAVNRLNNATLHDGATLTPQPSWALRRPFLYLSNPELFSLEVEIPEEIPGTKFQKYAL
jgi:beta-1,4-mannosyl-glycoprotein beta-1,4-N-acetylglucosaminyltransferase